MRRFEIQGYSPGADFHTLGLTFDEATAAGVAIDLLNGPPESAPFHDGETWRAFAVRACAGAAPAPRT